MTAAAATIDCTHQPTLASFRSRWLAPGKPAVIEGLTDAWSARRWTPETLVERCGDAVVTVVRVKTGRASATPGRRVALERMRLADAASSWESETACYVMTNTHDLPAPLLAEFARPGLCGRQWWGRSKLWLGPAGTVTTMHQDANDNLVVQLSGSKRFVLCPPGDRRNLYACARWSRTPNLSPVDPSSPDFRRYPRVARAAPLELVLEAGQTLFIPRFWWHHVTALAPAIGLNFWWSSGLRALRTIPLDILFVLRGRYR